MNKKKEVTMTTFLATVNYKDIMDQFDPINYEIENCLISQTPLTETHVRLECGHAFNYIPLYNELRNTVKGKKRIQCPYCRKLQSTLLPYYKLPGVAKVKYVNYNPSLESQIRFVIGKCSHEECVDPIVKLIDEQFLCQGHMKSEKAPKKLEVPKSKDATTVFVNAITSAVEKVLPKPTKKPSLKKVIAAAAESMSTVSPVVLCSEVLKSGKNKGSTCGNKTATGESFCKKHGKKGI